MGTAPRFEMRNNRSCKGRDGIAWSGTLYVDGVKAADVQNDGCGGSTNIRWTDAPAGYWSEGPLAAIVRAHVATLPAVDYGPELGTMALDLESFVSQLADEAENAKRIKRLCKTSTLFRTPTTRAGEWQCVNAQFTPAVRATIAAKYGAIEFANDRFA